MPPYRIADLSPQQLGAIENLEDQLGVTLVAWASAGSSEEQERGRSDWEQGERAVIDALNSTYEVGEFGDGYLYH